MDILLYMRLKITTLKSNNCSIYIYFVHLDTCRSFPSIFNSKLSAHSVFHQDLFLHTLFLPPSLSTAFSQLPVMLLLVPFIF